MNIPNKVKIGWKQYDVEQKEIDSSLVSDYTELFGQVFFGEQKIFINQSYDDGQRECLGTPCTHSSRIIRVFSILEVAID
ncbi:hypothetical protein [Eubacterium aggregans]|uniref:hypothetical protein n=1 Tax=Eubacterium aggregans TaxID=81409 RepID=UPI003F3241EB